MDFYIKSWSSDCMIGGYRHFRKPPYIHVRAKTPPSKLGESTKFLKKIWGNRYRSHKCDFFSTEVSNSSPSNLVIQPASRSLIGGQPVAGSSAATPPDIGPKRVRHIGEVLTIEVKVIYSMTVPEPLLVCFKNKSK